MTDIENVPEVEVQKRISRFQEILAKKNLDGALIMQNVDIFYFSGTIQNSILFLPQRGEPCLMVQKSLDRAREESPLKNIVPMNNRKSLFQLIGELDGDNFRSVGIEMDVLPTSYYLWLKEHLPTCQFVDVSEDIRRLRMIKSPYEVNQIRKATEVVHWGFMKLGEIIKEGMTELEVDAHLAFMARRNGHMGIMRMRAWNQEMTISHVLSGENGAVTTFLNSPHGGTGNTPAMAQGAGNRRLRRNEPIGIDYGVGINGYMSDQFRTFLIGEISPDLERAHDCCVRIHEMLQREARPGVPCSNLYFLSRGLAQKEGYGDFFMGYGEGQVPFIGHGIGLEIDEYPLIAPRFSQELKEGMVFAFEPTLIFPGAGVIGVEDDYLVTASGLERLTLTDQGLIRIRG
ncbi:MAG: aminopeptidase P family protein [Deltaproteobacteria bacterium]|nr:aminopeptidase P family protein [Deltaproteobacteria bacterium]MBW2139039.1 aminopeptidase P family protein [Deltaproteobacteria bacterium]